MTTNEPDTVPTAPKAPRRRTPKAEPEAVQKPAPEAMAAEPAAGADLGAGSPGIDEDGAWIEAEAVEVHQGAVGRVDAVDVAVTQGVVGAARGDRVSVEMGVLGAALGGEVSVSQGAVGTMIAREARVEQSFVRTLVAQTVNVHRPSAVLFMVAQRVSGDVKVLLDWRGALAFGAAAGLLAGLFGRGRGKG